MRSVNRSSAWSGSLGVIVVGAIVAVLLGGLGAAPASAAKDPRDRRQEVNRERERLAAELEDTDADLAAAFLALKDTEASIGTANIDLGIAEATLAEAQRKDAELADRLEVAEAQETELGDLMAADSAKQSNAQNSLGALARDSLRNGSQISAVSVALGSANPEEYIEHKAALDTVMRLKNSELSSLQETGAVNRNRESRLTAIREEIAVLKAEAAANVKIADDARDAAQAQRDSLVQLKAVQSAQAADVEAKKQNQLAQDAQLASEQTTLDAEIAEIARQQAAAAAARAAAEKEAAKNNAGSSGGSAGGGSAGGGSGGGGGGGAPAPSGRALSYPTQSTVVTSPYGWRIHPVLGTQMLHAGTDLRAYCGVPIFAAADGTVKKAANAGTYGNQVLLDNGSIGGGNYITSYNHLTKFNVSAGQRVSRGSIIGYAGKTGRVTACHLHFEVFVNGSRINPMSAL